MTQHSDSIYLGHMLDHAREALAILGENSRGSLAESRILQLALLHLAQIIGEAASKVSPATRAELSQLPWRGMVGMRNRITHGYDTVDTGVLWDTLKHDLPELIGMLEACLPRWDDRQGKPDE
ncbi:MAG: DUF86 domain-containing protein [Candidatus Hydrogenedentes bacterium]|nr:DUF86 domain-containing protein [Candidatus Hydrogenedentota bacterium]